jgi:glycosyltransferase involved in cell wall biosynthesis
VKIAIWHNLPSGGGKRALYDHVKGLRERGHYLEAWCPPMADRSYLPLDHFISEHVVPLDRQYRGRGRWLGNTFANTTSDLAAMERHCVQCAAEIRQGDFDLLLAGPCQIFRTNPIAKYVNLPSALYLQETFRALYEATPQLPWAALPAPGKRGRSVQYWKNLLADFARTQALRIQVREEIANAAEFDLILVNSLFSRESILRAYGLEAKVCYLGISGDEFKPSGEKTESYVIGLGGLSYAKGADRAIRALGCVEADKRPELRWVGNFSTPEYERELRTLAAQCGVRFTVKVMVSDAELVSLLSRAVMLLYTPRLEPFGLAPLEANACGTPVVAIAEGGVRETIVHEENGLLVDGDDPERLAQAIERLIDDIDFTRQLRERSLRHVRARWGVKAAIDRLEIALLELKEGMSGTGSETRTQLTPVACV